MSRPNPGPKGHAVSDLLEQVVDADGGLRTWREVRTVTTGLTTRGITWSLKGQSVLFGDVILDVTTTDQVLRVHPFVNKGCRGLYTPQRVRIESSDGAVLEDRHHPRDAFVGHTLSTPWDHLHGLYFGGYALWNSPCSDQVHQRRRRPRPLTGPLDKPPGHGIVWTSLFKQCEGGHLGRNSRGVQ